MLSSLQNAKSHREKELKKAESDMSKAKQRAENSIKLFKTKEQVTFFFSFVCCSVLLVFISLQHVNFMRTSGSKNTWNMKSLKLAGVVLLTKFASLRN